MRLQLSGIYEMLTTFLKRFMKVYPAQSSNTWSIYHKILQERKIDMMKGLNDLEQLSRIDWRFAVLTKLLGLTVNKERKAKGTKDNGDNNILAILIDTDNQVMISFVGQLLS